MIDVLFIGGTGILSSACAPRAIADGMRVTLLNRGTSRARPVPAGAEVIHADIRDPDTVRDAVRGRDFDVVVDFVAFTPEQVRTDIELFGGRTGQ